MTDKRENKPCGMSMKAGIYAWCSCALSESQPFCDGSHKGTGKAPVVCEIPEDGMVYWCQCRETKKPPFCDGSHTSIEK